MIDFAGPWEVYVSPKMAVTLVYKGKRYYFCMTEREQRFEAPPELFLPA